MTNWDMAPDHDDPLIQDADFHTSLSRVNYAPGMLLGVKATQAEQAYHRQRLNRHHYWLHGAGTIVGLAVTAHHSETSASVELIVSPGIAIDRLGREIASGEPYCVNLRDWVQAQLPDGGGLGLLQDGLEAGGDYLSLLVTFRYRGCASGLQPVMARKANAGTDPVDASRTQDGLLLEIVPGIPPEHDDDWFWPGHDPVPVADEPFTTEERQYLDSLSGDERRLKQMQARLLYALPNHNEALQVRDDPEIIARTLLAQVRIAVSSNGAGSPFPDFESTQVNNMVRPFVTTPDQLVRLTRQE